MLSLIRLASENSGHTLGKALQHMVILQSGTFDEGSSIVDRSLLLNDKLDDHCAVIWAGLTAEIVEILE